MSSWTESAQFRKGGWILLKQDRFSAALASLPASSEQEGRENLATAQWDAVVTGYAANSCQATSGFDPATT